MTSRHTLALALFATSAMPALAQDCLVIGGDTPAGEALNLDPLRANVLEDALYQTSIYERLADFDSTFTAVPRLAESWESNEDATEWTFTLREGVTFHSGKPLAAADVVYSFQRLLDPELQSAALQALSFLNRKTIEAVDDRTVRFRLDEPMGSLPLMITNRWTFIVPEGATEEALNARPDGTNAFQVTEFTRGAPSNTLQAYEGYWDAELPTVPCLTVRIITDPITRSAALISGELDVATAIDPQLVPLLERTDDVDVLPADGGGTAMAIAMQVDQPPFDDVRVREAMKLVVDRQGMVNTAFLGLGEVGNDTPVPPSSPLAHLSEPKAQDLDRARELLAEAGYPDGLTVELHTSPTITAGMMNFAAAYAQMASGAGITVDVVNAPAASYWSETWNKNPMFTSFWTARAPADALSIAYRAGSGWNETKFDHPEFEAALDEANRTADPNRQRELLMEAQRILETEGGSIIPGFFPTIAAVRAECSGYEPHPSRVEFDFRSITCD